MSLVGDNFHFDIAGAPLHKALEVGLAGWSNVVGWSTGTSPDGTPRLVLYWTNSDKATPLPAALSGDALREFVLSWLKAVDFGPAPDIDGSLRKSVRIYNEAWGRVDNDYAAFIAIEPHWQEFGK